MRRDSFALGRSIVGDSHPTYFIAEIGSNFEGDFGKAVELIYAAKEAGANAAKFQHYEADSLVSDQGFKALGVMKAHQSNWSKSVFETYRAAALPIEWIDELAARCNDVGIDFITAPYSLELTKQVEPHVCAIKIGSGDITWHESIALASSFSKPILIATGASTAEEVRMAVECVSSDVPLVVMQCNTNYSGAEDEFDFQNLRVLAEYADWFPRAVLGLSDHTKGDETVLAAVALGARVIEKHFSLDGIGEMPDHSFSMLPHEWHLMVARTRRLERALGDGLKKLEANETETVVVQRRAIRASRDMAVGEMISEQDLVYLRPCPNKCLEPYKKHLILGRILTKAVKKGEAIIMADIGDAN